MKNEELISQLKKEFAVLKKELGIKASFKELDDVFFFRDFILEKGFIGQKLHRDLSYRISSLFHNWCGVFQNWLIPNNGSYVSMVESNCFDEADKEKIQKILYDFMALTSKNSLEGFTGDKKSQGEYFDKSLLVWEQNKTYLTEFLRKANNKWSNP